MKKILGILFIILASILSLITVFSLIPNLFSLQLNFTEEYELGYSIGKIIYALIHISINIFLWFFGLRWIKKSKS